MNTKRLQFPYFVTIASIFAFVSVVLSGALIFLAYQTGLSVRKSATDNLIRGIQDLFVQKISDEFGALSNIESAVLKFKERNAPLQRDEVGVQSLMRAFRLILSKYESTTAVYIGYSDGTFFFVGNLLRLPEASPSRFTAPLDSVYETRLVTSDLSQRSAMSRFFDVQLTQLVERVPITTDFDPRNRPWYQLARTTSAPVVTDPYVFASSRQVGFTIAQDDGKGTVIGIDLTTNNLSNELRGLKFSSSSVLVLFDVKGNIFAHSSLTPEQLISKTGNQVVRFSEMNDPLLNAVQTAYQNGKIGKTIEREVQGQSTIVHVSQPLTAGNFSGYVGIAAPLNELNRAIDAQRQRAIVTALVLITLGLVFIIYISSLISKPLQRIALATERIGKFELDTELDERSRITEVMQLSVSIEKMRGGLLVFGQYIPKQLVRRIIASPMSVSLGGERRELTLMFTDVQGFTGLSETLTPEELMNLTSQYFEAIGDPIAKHKGIVDKYIGDSVMAIWNAPDWDSDHAENACRAALAVKEAVQHYNNLADSNGKPRFETRIGINTGDCVVGNVGSTDRMNFTAFGPVVNTASRIEGLNKIYGTTILVSSRNWELTKEKFHFRLMDNVVPLGAADTISIFELLGEISSKQQENCDLVEKCQAWNQAISLYHNGEFGGARAEYLKIIDRDPSDDAARLYLQRCETFIVSPPKDWDGISRPLSK